MDSDIFASKLHLILWSLLATPVIYVVTTVIYQLFYSPLSHIPGPKLAACTRLYEFYYDVVLHGRYTFKIAELHEKYGKSSPLSGKSSTHIIAQCAKCLRPHNPHQPWGSAHQ